MMAAKKASLRERNHRGETPAPSRSRVDQRDLCRRETNVERTDLYIRDLLCDLKGQDEPTSLQDFVEMHEGRRQLTLRLV